MEELIKLLNDEFKEYENKNILELKEILNIDSGGKAVNNLIFNKIIDKSNSAEKIKELIKEKNCVIKTINFEWNYTLKESMSLKAFKYEEIVEEEWENSNLRMFFDETVFIFVILRTDFDKVIFERICVWKMPNEIIDTDVKKVWEQTKKYIQDGKIVKYIDNRNRYITYFPAKSDTKVIHVRPHARDFNDCYKLPVKDVYTGKTEFMKHSFWINNSFIKKVVLGGKYSD